MTTVEVVFPCLDEAESLPGVLGRVPAGYAVLVVDNGSTDATADVASELGARVVTEHRRGYGAAAHAGLESARGEVVAVLDADGSLDPAQLPDLVAAVTEGASDLAVGRRVPVHRSAQPWHTRLGNAALAALLRRRGVSVHDLAAVRVGRRDNLLALGVTDRGFGYPLELLLRAAQAGWTVLERDLTYRPRTGGKSKVSGSPVGTLRAVRDLTKVVLRT